MTGLRDLRPGTLVPSLLAALTTWVTLLAWTPFAEHPAGFMMPLLGACLLVAVSGMLLRSTRLPASVVALVQGLLLLLWLQHRLAPGTALVGLVPTPESVRTMAAALHAAGVASQTFSAPVPASAPEFYPLLVVTGSLTALLVDLLAVGLRRVPLAGLPLLAAYTAPVSVLDGGVSWVKFAAAALCFLFLIAAGEQQRLGHWGRQLTPAPGLLEVRTGPGGQALWSSARKIGFTATALAVVVPVLVPTISGTWFSGGGGRDGGPGDGVAISNPMVDLKRDLVRGADVDVVTEVTTDPDPSYLRISVLDSFDRDAWRPSGRDIPPDQRANGVLPPPPGLLTSVPSRTYSSRVHIGSSFSSRWLPSPYPASYVDAPGDWRYDRTTLDFVSAANHQTTAGISYRLRSLALSPTATELNDASAAPASVSTHNTALPRDLPDYVRRLARQVTVGKTSKFEQAVALQEFFRVSGGFRYSLQRAAGNGSDELVRFLRPGKGGRVGYCEQFAAAMAVMGRTLGIPSRVAVGFLHPDQTSAHTFVYSTHDLHSWPEMYFGGVGWVRFEPTPQGRTGGVPAYTTQQVSEPQAPTNSLGPTAAPSARHVDAPGDGQSAAPTTGTSSSSHVGTALAWVGAALLVALLLLSPRSLRSLLRRRRWAAAVEPREWVEAAWREVRDTATDLAISWDEGVTLRAAESRLAATFGDPHEPDDALARSARRGPAANPEATAALHRLVELLERARYARELPPGAADLDQLTADTETCVDAMRAGAGRRRRARATWLPLSVIGSPGARRDVARRPSVLGESGVDRTVRSGA